MGRHQSGFRRPMQSIRCKKRLTGNQVVEDTSLVICASDSMDGDATSTSNVGDPVARDAMPQLVSKV